MNRKRDDVVTKSTIIKSKLIIFSIAALSFMSFIILMPKESANAVKFGLTVCGEIVVPSLFPFAFICIFIYSSNISKIFNKILNKPMQLLNLTGDIGTVIFMSLIGGYPVGSKMISKLYEDEIIDIRTANILLMFCVNPGPAFVIVAVGNGMLRDYKAGVILFASCIIASVVLLIILCLFLKPKSTVFKKKSLPLPDAMIKSISEASASTIQICSFVVIFSCIGCAIKTSMPNGISTIFISLLEVTNGCLYSSKISIYLIAFILSFAGIAVHFQIFSFCGKMKIDYALFYIGRIIHGLITVVIVFILEKIFPITKNVAAYGEIKNSLEISATSVCSLCLVCTSFVIMCYWILSLKEIDEKKNAR